MMSTSKTTRPPTYRQCTPKSSAAGARARGCSGKSGNKPEMLLRRQLHALGLRFRVANNLLGKPDVVFPRKRVAVFVDGDFWHGRDVKKRLAKLAAGHNATYWMAKIISNRARDARVRAALRRNGWTVVRVWESDLRRAPEVIARKISKVLCAASPPQGLRARPTHRSLSRLN
jgi:DNA mismatch endonuclease, patch repair protein